MCLDSCLDAASGAAAARSAERPRRRWTLESGAAATNEAEMSHWVSSYTDGHPAGAGTSFPTLLSSISAPARLRKRIAPDGANSSPARAAKPGQRTVRLRFSGLCALGDLNLKG
jgi:hypothetical protein